MSNQKEAEKILAGVVHENMNVEYRISKAQALATLALADAVRGAAAAAPPVVEVDVDPQRGVSIPQEDARPSRDIKVVYVLTRSLNGAETETMGIYLNKVTAEEESARLNEMANNQGVDSRWGITPYILKEN